MDTRYDSPRSRLLVAVGVLALAIIACGASGSAKTPTPAARKPVTVRTALVGTTTPRSIPTLVPTYTRVPTWTPTPTPTSTSTRTATPTRTETRTPRPTNTPNPTPPPVSNPTNSTVPTAARSPAPPPEPECPAPEQRTDLRGKIIFLTDREDPDNENRPAYYVMNPDGSDQKPISQSLKCGKKTYDYFENRLSLSNDGQWRLTVERTGNGTSIFLRDAAGKLVRRVTTLDQYNYNPAWAPDQARLAFVSQVDMNDEIYIARIDDGQTRRLTFNTWEWDKHPAWSVDGKFLVFWSNRATGRKQIWMMRDDGGGAINISNNSYNDWDPIWVYPS